VKKVLYVGYVMNDDYGALFRDAYAVLHGGRAGEHDSASGPNAGEPLEEYLSRTRTAAIASVRKQLLAAEAPEALQAAHSLLLDLLSNAEQADEALSQQVRSYQCGNFHDSVTHSDRLQDLVVRSQALDRDLIVALREAEERSPGILADLGVEA
jgi:hypothetical protein